MREMWTEDSGPHWIANYRLFDTMLQPFCDALIEALTVQPGGQVLDVGCGPGTLTAAVTKLGLQVVGADISSSMVAGARARFPGLTFEVADAQTDDLGGPYDAVVSRFGVMFFEDPVAAFRNIARFTADGGTLLFVCWRGVSENPIFTSGARALRAALPEPPPPADPLAPGPTAFADDARLRAILIDAGWTAVEIEPLDATCHFAVDGSDGVEERIMQLRSSESGRMLLAQVAPADQPAAWEAARAELRTHLVDGELQLPGAAWFVRARR